MIVSNGKPPAAGGPRCRHAPRLWATLDRAQRPIEFGQDRRETPGVEQDPSAGREPFFPEREPRHRLHGLPEVQLMRQSAEASDAQSVRAQLLDISPGGFKLSLATPLRLGEAVSLAIVTPDHAIDLSLDADVRWIRPGEGKTWSAGCTFNPRLPEETLRSLFSRGLLERRKFPRQKVRATVSVQWELEPNRTAASLRNLSVGGFCLEASERGKPGERVLVFLEDADGKPQSVPGKAQWQMKKGERYVLGCTFVNNQGYPTMHDFLERREARPHILLARQLPLLGVAAAVVLYWMYWSMFLR
jgi:hypothetical protein